jgi:hypothetical protein
MDTYEFHPFADAFPMMTDQEHAALVADIKANGVRDNIILYQGKILDGRNRYKALVELGRDLDGYVDEEVEGFLDDDEEALAYVISKNLVRRHLNESQRAMVAAKLSDLQTGQRADQVQGLPIGRAASMLNVGERSVARAKKVLDKGTVEQIAAVDRGEVAVSKAVKQIDEAAPIGRAATNGHDDLETPIVFRDSAGNEHASPFRAFAANLAEAVAAPKERAAEQGKQDARRYNIKQWEAMMAANETYVPNLENAVIMVMHVETIEDWLAGSSGGKPCDLLRRLNAHVNELVTELDSREAEIKVSLKSIATKKADARKAKANAAKHKATKSK